MVNVGKYTKSHGCYGCLKSYVGKALESPSAEAHPRGFTHAFSRQNLGPRDIKIELLLRYI